MSIVFLFPGQGSQTIGMGQALAQAFPVAMQTFEEAERVTGIPLRTIAWEGPENLLTRTDNAQVALFVCSVAALKVWRELGGPEPFAVAGHSLGEYSALVATGALEFTEALSLVRLRGQLMAKAGEIQEGTMAAVLGMGAEELEGVTQRCRETVVVANYNTAEQLVLSGTPQGVAEASEKAKEHGAKRVIPLSVSGAFHSPLMEPALGGLTEALQKAPWRDARVPVYTNVDASATVSATAFADKLSRQLASPVRWWDTLNRLHKDGADAWVEMGSGKVLIGMVKKLDRAAGVFSTEDPDSLKKAIEAVNALTSAL